MRSERELGSAYGPIRLRGSMGYVYAQQAARAGAITVDGMVSSTLYASINRDIFEPAIASVAAAVRSGEYPEDCVGQLLAKLKATEHWVPMYGQYELAGRQIFDLHDRLTDMLLATDLGDSTLENLHLPYDALYLRFGAQDSIKLPFDEDRFEFFDGAFVARSPWDESGSRIKIGFTTVHEDGTGVDYPGYFFDILPSELSLPVEEAIEVAMARLLATYRDDEGASPNTRALNSHLREYVEESATMIRAAAALLVNALFYVESISGALPAEEPGRDTPPERVSRWMHAPLDKRRKQRSALTADGYAIVRLVGKEVATEAAPSAGIHASVRVHWRRGHWRQQRHGAGRALIKRIWIKPVLVGKDAMQDDTPVPGHVYAIGAPDRVQ